MLGTAVSFWSNTKLLPDPIARASQSSEVCSFSMASLVGVDEMFSYRDTVSYPYLNTDSQWVRIPNPSPSSHCISLFHNREAP